jgi:hypothetical protein
VQEMARVRKLSAIIFDAVVAGAIRDNARCAFSDRNLHSRMPLDPTHVRL